MSFLQRTGVEVSSEDDEVLKCRKDMINIFIDNLINLIDFKSISDIIIIIIKTKMTSMIKGIIQKIIVSNFGKFIKGIDRDKLSVDLFGGKFKLENISLNHEYFDSLNTPFRLAYSSIGKLNLNASISKLSSVPVECTLDNIYVVFEFKNHEEHMGDAKNKMQKLVQQVGEIFESYAQKIKEEKKEDGMMGKMAKKVLDNLQMKIVNVHIRFQESAKNNIYGWGITLKELSLCTTDSQWKPSFIQRNEKLPQKLFKMMKVNSLNFYWQSGNKLGEKILINREEIEKKYKKQAMASMILQNEHNVISLTSEFKMVINPLQEITKPIYQLDVNLQPIQFDLQRIQLLQMIDFFQKNMVQSELILRNMSKKKKLSQDKQDQLRQYYCEIINQIIEIKSSSEKQIKQKNLEQNKLREIMEKVDTEKLMIWMLEPIKKKVKILKEDQVKKKKAGWFSKADDLTKEEIQQLQSFVENMFQNQTYVRSPGSQYFMLNLRLLGGKFNLISLNNNTEEVIQFEIGQIQCFILKSQDQSHFQSELEISSISLNLCLPVENNGVPGKKRLEILTNQNTKGKIDDQQSMKSFSSEEQETQQKKPQSNNFMKLKYKNQILENKSIIKKTIEGEIDSVIVIYKRLYMKKFKQFFTFKNIKPIVKQANIDNTFDSFMDEDEPQEQEISKIEKQIDVKLNVNSPVFLCPLNQRQCWCLNLGNLEIGSKRTKNYEEFPMNVKSAFLRYYPNISHIYSDKIFTPNCEKAHMNSFSLINDMNFKVLFHKQRTENYQQISVDLPRFAVNFTHKQYENLLSLKQIFEIEQSEQKNMIETLKQVRKNIEKTKSFAGSIMKKHETLYSWKQFHGILSEEFLYLYNNKKDLRQAEKILIKNSKLSLIQQDQEKNQSLENSFELLLINQHTQCNFSCQELNDLLTWKFQMEKKARQFKTIYELMKNYDSEDIESSRKKRVHSQSSDQEENLTEKKRVLKININQIEFQYLKEEGDSIMDFKIEDILFKDEQTAESVEKTFIMKKMSIIDKIYLYKNQRFQPLIIAQEVQTHIKRPIVSTRKLKQKQHTVSVQLKQLYINWKPDIILNLMSLMSKHFKGEGRLRLDDDIEKSRDEHFNEIYGDSKFKFLMDSYVEKAKGIFVKDQREKFSSKNKWIKERLKINLHLNDLEINMIHRESHIPMFKMISEGITSELVMNQSQKFAAGEIATLDIFDLTEYPKKSYCQGENHKPYLIMKKSQKKSKNSLVNYRWSSYDSSTLPNEERIDSFLLVEIEPLEYIYFQQITFRMIDYALIQIILLLTQPEMLTANENLMEQLKMNEDIKEKPIKILFSQYQEIIKKIVHPFFMDMYFKLKNPSLIIKSQKDSPIYYKTTMQQVTFFNRNVKTNKRFQKDSCKQIKQFIYQEEYVVEGKNCVFHEVKQDPTTKKIVEEKLFGPFEMDLICNKLILEDELNLVFPEITNYDRSFVTINNISPIIFHKFSRLQYLNLNKLVNFNFTFDDEWDELFIHNFKVTKLLSPKPIYYELRVPSIEMVANYEGKQNVEQHWKLFKADLQRFNMIYRRNKLMNSSFHILVKSILMKGYEYNQNSLSHEEAECNLIKISNSNSQHSTEIMIDNKVTGQKVIQMNVEKLDINVRTGLLQLVLEFSLIEDWVFPVVNKYVSQMTFYSTVHSMSAKLIEDPKFIVQKMQQQKKKIHLSIIENLLNYKYDLRMFKLEGQLIYKFHRKKDLSITQYRQKILKKELMYQDFQKMGENSYMNTILNTQVFIGSTHGNAKRKVIEKFTFMMNDTRSLRVADIKDCILKNISKKDLNIDRAVFKVSFKDLIFMKNILAQIEDQRKYINFLNRKTGNFKEINIEQVKKETEASSLDNLQLKVESMSLNVINSWQHVFIPILKVNLANFSLSKANTFKKDIFKCQLAFSVYYFNGLIFRWQPMLEKTCLFFHRLTYYQENNRVFGSFQTQNEVMVNISSQIFLSINETLTAWKQQSQSQENRYIEKQQVQPIQFINHYIIRNETGYPIDIMNQKGQIVKEVLHNKEIVYQLDMENYDEENQVQTFVGFKIKHPKYKFKAVRGVPFTLLQPFKLSPKLLDGSVLNDHSKIIIQTETKHCQKLLMIKSSKYVYEYFDNFCEIKALPFDHSKEIQIKQIKASLYESKDVKNFRFMGKNGILTIMQKFIVYNFTPISLDVCGKLVEPNEYVSISERPRIFDKNYNDSFLKVIKNQKLKEYYIFSECYVIDYYGLKLNFGKDDKLVNKFYTKKFEHKNYPYQVYILPQPEYKYKIALAEGKSSELSIKTTIGTTSFSLQSQEALCSFISNSYLKPVSNSKINQFSRVIELTPQYMLSNATKSLIKICQVESCNSIALQPYHRMPFFWENKSKPKEIKIASYDGKIFWGYSGSIRIEKSTQTLVLRNTEKPDEYRVFSIQIQVTNTVTIIHFMEPSARYFLSNTVQGTTMKVFQTAITDSKIQYENLSASQAIFTVAYGQQVQFGYELPLHSHKLKIMVGFDEHAQQYNGVRCNAIQIEDMQANLSTKNLQLINQNDKRVGYLVADLCFEKNLKKLILRKMKSEQEQFENSFEYIIKIPRVGISLIGNHQDMRKEIIHIILEKFDIEYAGNAEFYDFNLLLSRCRIENQLKENAIFPVVFESKHTKQAKYFINFLISRSAKNSRLIQYIGFSINKSYLCITSQEVQVLQQNLTKIMSMKQLELSEEQSYIRKCQMFNEKIPDIEESLYFVEAVIHPLKSNITFRHVNEWGGKLLKTLSSINQCPIHAEGQYFKHFSCPNLSFFISSIINHYNNQLKKMILPMIGNLTILGSPITLVQKIGSGFKDLVELPSEGFEISPLEGGKGVLKGAGSLVGKTVTGTFNTVESFTGSLSNGLTLLVDDDENFSQERQNIKNDRSSHVVGGLANGGKSIFNGFKNGLFGVISQPVKGAEKDGLLGFFKGTAKGLAGLAIKPVSGVIDAVSKTAEGIKNTPDFFSQQREKMFVRQHNPRPFYNYYKEFRNYDREMADLIHIILKEDEQKYFNLSWCGFYELKTQRQKSLPILILSFEYLFIYDFKKRRLLKQYVCDHFNYVQLNDESGNIKLGIRDVKNQRDGFVDLMTLGGCRKLTSEIGAIIQYYHPRFVEE